MGMTILHIAHNILYIRNFFELFMIVILLSMDKLTEISFRRLFRANERLEKYLKEIVKQVKPKTQFKVLEFLNRLVAKPLIWDHFFKLLILLNNFIVNDQIPHSQTAKILNLMKIDNKYCDDFDNVLINELLVPYRFYLEKRCTIFENFEKQECKAKLYALLNLLNSGSYFSKMIFRLGRYYQAKLKYAQDFNIAWAADLSKIYYLMTKNITFPIKEKLKHQIQLIHEPLYNVFYNIYFHQYIERRFIPDWIITDDTNQQQIRRDHLRQNPQMNQKKRELDTVSPNQKKQNKNLDSTNVTRSNQEKTEFSILHLHEQNEKSPIKAQLDLQNQVSIQVGQFNYGQEKEVNEADLLQFMELTKQFQHLEIEIRRVECLQSTKI